MKNNAVRTPSSASAPRTRLTTGSRITRNTYTGRRTVCQEDGACLGEDRRRSRADSLRGLLDSNGSWRRRRRRVHDRRGNLLAGTQAVEIVSPRLHHLATLRKALRLVIRRAHFIAF